MGRTLAHLRIAVLQQAGREGDGLFSRRRSLAEGGNGGPPHWGVRILGGAEESAGCRLALGAQAAQGGGSLAAYRRLRIVERLGQLVDGSGRVLPQPRQRPRRVQADTRVRVFQSHGDP